MKKIIFPIAILGISFTLFSFSTNEVKKADYNEVKNKNFVSVYSVATFTRYESHHYTGDKGSWNRRVSVWSMSDQNESLDQIELALNN
jgi:hypothetical protein